MQTTNLKLYKLFQRLSFFHSEHEALKMLRIASVLVLVAAASCYDMPEFHVKYSMTGTPGVDSFFPLARTELDAIAEKWVRPEETKANKQFSTYCQENDARVCTLFDNKGTICGHQISIPRSVDNMNITGINYTKQGFLSTTLFGTDYYSNQIFFVSQETIAKGGREFNNQTGEGLWLQTGDGLVQIPPTQSEMEDTDFVKQRCFIRMGQHYFWKASKSLTQEDFRPWFILFDNDENLIGFGFIAFGTKESDYKKAIEKWFEDVPAAAIQMIAPSSPEWVFDYIDKYGILSQHIYFGKAPWKVTCPAASAPKISKY